VGIVLVNLSGFIYTICAVLHINIMVQIGTYLDYFYENIVYSWPLYYYTTSLPELAVETGQDLKKITFKDQSWLGLKTRSRKLNM
jgi:hypothetical protein